MSGAPTVPPQVEAALASGWSLAGAVAPLGQGLINDTWQVRSTAGRYVLQRINRLVFFDPERLMDNVVRVVAHVNARAPGLVPELVPATDAAWFHVDAGGEYWRVWRYVEDTVTREQLDNAAQAEQAGGCFARFQRLLAELPKPPLATTLPGFMRLTHYLRELDAQVAKRRPGDERVALLLASVNQRRELADQFQTINACVHGDCKINNLLYRGDRAVCILDLDTVMPGHWAWDFGDLVRSAAAERDTFSLPLFAALAEGFVAACGHSPSMAELVGAPRYVGTMLAVRFLADHLAGNVYFRVGYPGENLVRAEAQMRLVEQMEAQESQMLDIVAALRP